MIVTPVVLIASQYAPGTATKMYSSPGSTNTIIDSLNACNNDASNPYTLSVWIVPSGGTPGNGNLLVNALSIAAVTTAQIIAVGSGGKLAQIILGAGDSIYIAASSASKIAIQASGRAVEVP